MCDKAEPQKCNSKLYFDQNQCPQVPGDNWSNDTEAVYQGLACHGTTCNCGAYPCGENDAGAAGYRTSCRVSP